MLSTVDCCRTAMRLKRLRLEESSPDGALQELLVWMRNTPCGRQMLCKRLDVSGSAGIIKNLVVCSVEAARSIKKSVVVVRRGLKSVVKERMPVARPSVTVQRRREAC